MHLSQSLPSQVEIGSQRRLDYNTEIVPTDSGAEVRNNRWSTPLRVWDVSFPLGIRASDPIYLAVVALYDAAGGNLHSFNFKDWVSGQTFAVRFDGPLPTVGVTPEIEHIHEVTLVEVRQETSP